MVEKVSLSPSKCVRAEDVAYIAGLVASDGHLDRSFPKVVIATSDEEFALKIRSLLEKVSQKESHIYKKSTAYAVEIWDKQLYDLLKKKYKIPSGKKSDILESPEITSEHEIMNFIRGFCDGDSSVHHRKMRKKFVPRIRIMSLSKKFLEWVREQLIKGGIRTGSPFIDKPHGFGSKVCYRIEIYGTAVRKFKERIGYLHPVKSRKIDEVILLLN